MARKSPVFFMNLHIIPQQLLMTSNAKCGRKVQSHCEEHESAVSRWRSLSKPRFPHQVCESVGRSRDPTLLCSSLQLGRHFRSGHDRRRSHYKRRYIFTPLWMSRRTVIPIAVMSDIGRMNMRYGAPFLVTMREYAPAPIIVCWFSTQILPFPYK